MKHLRYLKLINMVMAGMFLFFGIISVLLISVPVIIGLTQGGMGASEMAILAGAAIGSFVVLGLFAVLYFVAGRKVARGRGRVLQTILCVLSISNLPIGTAYGIFGLWVCWMNDETKIIFEEGGVLD